MNTVTANATPAQPPIAPAPRLLDQVRARIRVLRHSIRAERAYVDWIKRYIPFDDKPHPRPLSAPRLADEPPNAIVGTDGAVRGLHCRVAAAN